MYLQKQYIAKQKWYISRSGNDTLQSWNDISQSGNDISLAGNDISQSDMISHQEINRGYYMEARRYEFYVWVARTISHQWAQRTSERLRYWSCHENINSYLRADVCSFYYINILMTAFLMIFWRFPKIFQNCSESQMNVPEHFPRISENFRRCPEISKDCWRLLRETGRCFNDTPMNLSTIRRQTWYHQKHRYLHMWGYRIVFINSLVSNCWCVKAW